MKSTKPAKSRLTPFQRHARRWSRCQRCRLSQCRNRVVLARGRVPAEVVFVGEAPGASENVIGRPFVGPAGHLLDYVITQGLGPDFRSYAITNLVGCFPALSPPQVVHDPRSSDVWLPKSREWSLPFRVDTPAGVQRARGWYTDTREGKQRLKRLPVLAGLRIGCGCGGSEACYGELLRELFLENIDAAKIEPIPEWIEACRPRLAEFLAMSHPRAVVWVGRLAAKHGPYALPEDQRERLLTKEIVHPAAILRLESWAKDLAVQRAIVSLADLRESLDGRGYNRCL